MKLIVQKKSRFRLVPVFLLVLPTSANSATLPGSSFLHEPFAGYLQQTQETDEPSEPSGSSEFSGGGAAEEAAARSAEDAGPAEVSESFTSSVVAQLSVAGAACKAVDPEYRADCLAKELRAIAQQLPSSGDYAAARQALSNASRELASLSRTNRDNSQPRLRVTVQGEEQPIRRPVSAVKQETVAATNAKALAILEDTTTVLLRSAESSSKAAAHYQRIAQALNSSKVLLRS